MKRVLAMIIIVAGLVLTGIGINQTGEQTLTIHENSPVKQVPPRINMNLVLLFGITVTLGGTILYFLPNKHIARR